MPPGSSAPGPRELEYEQVARRLEREGKLEDAGSAYYQAAVLAWERRDPPRARGLTEQALEMVADGAPTSLRAGLRHLLSDLLAESGDLAAAAELSVRAELEFRAVGDERGELAVLTTRAIRALEVGDGERGRELAVGILPGLDRMAASAPRIWLRLHLAIWHETIDRAVDAVGWATEAMELAAPGSGEQLVAAAAAMRNLLHLGEAQTAADLGAGILANPAELAPAELRGEVFLLTATALRALGQEQLAHICASRATGLTSTGIELARRFYREQRGLVNHVPPTLDHLK